MQSTSESMLAKFNSRLQTNLEERDNARKEIALLDTKIQQVSASLPPRPDIGFKVKDENFEKSVDEKIAQLEKDQSQRSMGLQEEKALLKKIEKLKNSKREFDNFVKVRQEGKLEASQRA